MNFPHDYVGSERVSDTKNKLEIIEQNIRLLRVEVRRLWYMVQKE